MAIYTRTGDAGTTALFTGQRVSKTHPRVEAYGTLDELNAALSLCVCAAQSPQHRALLEEIQLQLFWFSAELASESEQPTPTQRYISSEDIAALEAAIDTAMARVPPLHSFILPGRCEAASRLPVALKDGLSNSPQMPLSDRYLCAISTVCPIVYMRSPGLKIMTRTKALLFRRWLSVTWQRSRHRQLRSLLCHCLFRNSIN